MSNDLIINELSTLPLQIKEAKEGRYEIILTRNEISDKLSYLEARIKEEILTEVDENGKNKYSNDARRKAEFDQRSKLDDEYSTTRQELMDSEKMLTFSNIKIEYLEDTQRNLRAILNYNSNI